MDCNHTFLESVNKLVSLMETGMVKGAETLVPHLFQFLVMLAYDSSKLVTVPHVSFYVLCVFLASALVNAMRGIVCVCVCVCVCVLCVQARLAFSKLCN